MENKQEAWLKKTFVVALECALGATFQIMCNLAKRNTGSVQMSSFERRMESFKGTSPFIYLDCNATTPLAEEVIEGITGSLIADWGNPSSGSPYGAAARAAITKARSQIADMLACSTSEVIFTSGGTESNNTILRSAVQYFKEQNNDKTMQQRPHIITTNVEHDSVILPILQLESVARYSIVKVDESGCVRVDDILSEITPYTCLITVMYANNETGVIMPIPELGMKILEINARRAQMGLSKILFHTDAAQIIGKEKISFPASNVDFMTVVGHKFYGPRIGCICAKEKIFPLLFGGGQENGLRSGSENTPMIVGLGIAAHLVHLHIVKYNKHMLKCRERLEAKLKEVFGDEVVINCKGSNRLPNTCNISFVGDGLEGPVVLSLCKKLIASVGAACHGQNCSQILIKSGVPPELAKNAIRLSIGRSTTFQDIDEAVLELDAAVKSIRTKNEWK